MNIIYLEKDKLCVIQDKDLPEKDLSRYFSSSKLSLVYIEDEEGKLIGYINHNLYKKTIKSENINVKSFKLVLIENTFNASYIDNLFEKNLDIDSIPVVNSENILVGVYLRTVSEELSSNERVMNTIALSVLPAFINEFKQFLKKRDISILYIIANEDDFVKIDRILGSIIKIEYFSRFEATDNALVIDMLYSKTYRSSISRSLKCQIVSLESVMAILLLPIAINFVKEHNANIYFIEGPIKDKIKDAKLKWPQLYMDLTLSKSVNDDKIMNCFFNGDQNLIEWARDMNNGILGGDEVCTNGIHLLMSQNLNIDNSNDNKSHMYLYGPCVVYGACVPQEYNLSSSLREMYPEYIVVNNAVKNGHSLLNDLLYILNTDIDAGDILIDINVFSDEISHLLRSEGLLYEFSDFFNRNMDSKCQFLDNTFHANINVTNILSKFIKSLIPNDNKSHFSSSSSRYFYETNKIADIDSSSILGKSLMGSYIDYVKSYKREIHEGQIVGSVILTANPITKGHEYLIKVAKSKCDILYVFIVEENSFDFTTTERLNLVRSVVDDPDIIVLTTGKVMTARYTFPDYYQKEHTCTDITLNPMSDLHFYLFGSIVAPILRISKRYVGEEIKGSVTDYYNNKLLSTLPLYGIDVEVIPRLCSLDGKAVSASKVRNLIIKQDVQALSAVLSSTVLEYVIETRFEHIIRKGRWSTAFRNGRCFIKKYKYYIPDKAQREAIASKAAYSFGINTPLFIKTKDDGKTITNTFEYIEMEPLEQIFKNNIKNFYTLLCNLLNSLSNVPWDVNDNYWRNSLIPEFKDALSYLDVDTEKYIYILDELVPEVFIHGDFTSDNLGYSMEGKLVVFDFQHGCLGPKGWDKYYFSATMLYDKCFFDFNDNEKSITELISAIRYGRSRRKNEDVEHRKEIFMSWINRDKQ